MCLSHVSQEVSSKFARDTIDVCQPTSNSHSWRSLAYEMEAEKQTKFELFSLLLHSGWVLSKKDNLRGEFVSKDEDGDILNKEFSIGKALRRDYLLSLLQAESLLHGDLVKIYHEQAKAYYACVLVAPRLAAKGLLSRLQPNQRAHVYKELLQAAKPTSKSNTAAKFPGIDAQGGAGALSFEEEVSFVQRADPTEVEAASVAERMAKSKRKIRPDPETTDPNNVDSESGSEPEMGERDDAVSKHLSSLGSRKKQVLSATGSTVLSQAAASFSKQSKVEAANVIRQASSSSGSGTVSQDIATATAMTNDEKSKKPCGSATDQTRDARDQLEEEQVQAKAAIPSFIKVKMEPNTSAHSLSLSSGAPVLILDSDDEAPPSDAGGGAPALLPRPKAAPSTSERSSNTPTTGTRAQANLSVESSSSMFNDSTVWFDNIPAIKRSTRGMEP